MRSEPLHRVLVNVAQSDWAVHFVGPDGRTRIGPWLLCDSHDEVLKILHWADISDEELAEHESSIRRWGCSSAAVMLTDAKLAALVERGRGWPWNGYELAQMKAAPARLSVPARPESHVARRSLPGQLRAATHYQDTTEFRKPEPTKWSSRRATISQ